MVMICVHKSENLGPWDAKEIIEREGVPVSGYDPMMLQSIFIEEKNAPCAFRVLIERQISFSVSYGDLSFSSIY